MPFPTTGILDTFNRADGALGSDWGSTEWGGAALKLVISGSLLASDGTTAYDDGWWNNSAFGTNQEAFVTVTTKPDATKTSYLFCRIQSPGSASSDGYDVEALNNTGAETFGIYRIDNRVWTILGATVSQAMNAGDKFGIQAIDTTISGWIYTSGAWSQVLNRTDATYSGGYIGVGTEGATGRYDDFGGGTIGFQPLPYLQQNFPGMAGYSDRPQKWN